MRMGEGGDDQDWDGGGGDKDGMEGDMNVVGRVVRIGGVYEEGDQRIWHPGQALFLFSLFHHTEFHCVSMHPTEFRCFSPVMFPHGVFLN